MFILSQKGDNNPIKILETPFWPPEGRFKVILGLKKKNQTSEFLDTSSKQLGEIFNACSFITFGPSEVRAPADLGRPLFSLHNLHEPEYNLHEPE